MRDQRKRHSVSSATLWGSFPYSPPGRKKLSSSSLVPSNLAMLAIFPEMMQHCESLSVGDISGKEADEYEENILKWFDKSLIGFSGLDKYRCQAFRGFMFDRLLIECIACFHHSIVDDFGIKHNILEAYSRWLAKIQSYAAESLEQITPFAEDELPSLSFARLPDPELANYEQAAAKVPMYDSPPSFEEAMTNSRRPIVNLYRQLLKGFKKPQDIPDYFLAPFRDGRFGESIKFKPFSPYTRAHPQLQEQSKFYLLVMGEVCSAKIKLWNRICTPSRHSSSCNCLKCPRTKAKIELLTQDLCQFSQCPGVYRMYLHLMILFIDVISKDDLVHPKYKQICRTLKSVILDRLDPAVVKTGIIDAAEKLGAIRQWDENSEGAMATANR